MTYIGIIFRRKLHSDAKNTVLKIGNIKVPVRDAKRPELVPTGFADKNLPPSIIHAIKWLIQKDALQQDVFLIGLPGFLRSFIVFSYLDLTNREFEYLSVTRDTTEADIKQRREISGGNAFYSDLCAVRAAINGRVLIIDGVEKAERNVLPILNNLLENREMQLDDGRFLMAARKYDKLKEKYSEEELQKMKLERVSESFHVIALGLPVPTFKGHTLDPPLRSRFQCRNITELPFETMSQLCSFLASNVGTERVNNLLALVYGLNSQNTEKTGISLPLFPTDTLLKIMKIWNLNPSLPEETIFNLSYPKNSILKEENQLPILEEFFENFSTKRESKTSSASIKEIEISNNSASIKTKFDGTPLEFNVPAGSFSQLPKKHEFVSTKAHESLLTNLLLTHSTADFCLLGPRGSGKSTIVEEFSQRLGYETETIVLYQDMNSRELIQQRRMLSNGDTVWEDSQLVRAAKKGALCILDGLEKVHWSTAEMLAPLIHHRYLQLPDGSRLIGSMYFDAIKAKTGFTDELLAQKGVFKISDNFRLIALADSESVNSTKWLNEQILSMFIFHNLKPMSIKEQCEVIAKLIPNVDIDVAHRLVSLVERLRASTDSGIRGISISLSLRRLIYILRRYTQNPDEGIFNAIHRSALSRFMPTITRTAFDKALSEAGIGADAKAGSLHDDSWKERLLETSKKSSDSVEHESMVPDIVFFDNKQHLKVMDDMAKDFELGSHLLVIGNQGVGKNKITDRFLQLIQRPRQYMQLHRDTTVQSLTVQSTVIDGILKHEDSPLVKAVRDGLVLVVDEADKAPLHVVAILKSLIDSGILYLSDGRRIQPSGFPIDPAFKPIKIHPDFRLIMLANRPGFPFLGNDLFAVLGDLFSIHVVDNPSRASELAMLKQYGPNVKDEYLQQLVSAFDELREMADNSLLTYPYSTRELVNIVKHLQVYPNDPLTVVVRNVFDFDSYTKETIQSIEAVFQKYGIPLGIKNPEENVFLSRRFPIEESKKIGEWKIKENTKPFLIQPKIVPLISEKEFEFKKYAFNLEMHHSRASMFSEQKFFWQLPTSDVNICSDILEIGNGKICVSTVNPPTLYYIPDQRKSSCVEIDLSQQFTKFSRGEFHPRFTLANWTPTTVLIHEETTNTLLLADFEKLKINKLGSNESTVLDSIVEKFSSSSISNGTNHWRLINHAERPILFNRGSNELQILFPGDLPAGAEIISLPDGFSITNILSASKDKFLISTNKGTFLLTFETDGRVFLRPLKEDSDIPLHFDSINKMMQTDNNNSDNSNPTFILTHEDFYAIKSENFPEFLSTGEVYAWRRPSTKGKNVQQEIPYRSLKEKFPLIHPQKEVVIFDNGVIVRALPKWKTPERALPKNIAPSSISGFLEVVDPRRNNVQYIPVPASRISLYHSSWVASISKTPFTISKGSDGKSLYTCETNGAIRKWEIDEIELMSSLQAWHKLFGTEDPNERIEFERDESQIDMSKLTEPTLGKFDPKNTPHVGGNMWQGGTGGYNTAGLGGVGGPFRLDAGHDVHQIHEGAKAQVPEDYKRKAREINRREYQKRLKDIDMNEHDAETYETFKEKIKKQVTHMKSIIDSLEAREQERQWVKHQTSGDLDDAKLIEGLTGEKGIYRRRMEQLPEPGAIQTKPKRLRLVFDVSGSMYRFNGHDQRLQKSMEAALMVMEALDGKQDKIKYDIVGHSGDGPEMIFTTPDKPPSNEKQKFDVAKKMFLQSQFCYSGDFTLEALQMAISKISKESDVDERFVIVLSDANLDRYGIKPHHLAKRLEADPKVHAFVILVGSLGAQAEKLVKSLPAGKAFYASDTAQLPHIIQNIFASTLIK